LWGRRLPGPRRDCQNGSFCGAWAGLLRNPIRWHKCFDGAKSIKYSALEVKFSAERVLGARIALNIGAGYPAPIVADWVVFCPDRFFWHVFYGFLFPGTRAASEWFGGVQAISVLPLFHAASTREVKQVDGYRDQNKEKIQF